MSTQAILTVAQPSRECLVLGGEVDLSNAAQLKEVLDGWLKQSLSVYKLDVRGLKRIDSSALGLIVGAYRRAIIQKKPKASFELHAGGPVLRVIQLIGLDRVLPVVKYDD